jgi:hypothetical protein
MDGQSISVPQKIIEHVLYGHDSHEMCFRAADGRNGYSAQIGVNGSDLNK